MRTLFDDPAPARRRIFLRCSRCLAIGTTSAPDARVACACGGEVSSFGEVDLPTSSAGAGPVPAGCDDRCRLARGPSCDCACGGENHGAGLPSVESGSTLEAVVAKTDPALVEVWDETLRDAEAALDERRRRAEAESWPAWRRDREVLRVRELLESARGATTRRRRDALVRRLRSALSSEAI